MSQQQHIIPPYPYSMYPPMPMWQPPLNNVTNTYQHQGGPQHQGGTCCKRGGGAKHKCQQQQQQYQQQYQKQYQQQYQPITNKYCWTHVGCNHFGSGCRNPVQGH
eukprot:939407-Ditylum_brightwellii.AAC.1